MGTSGSQKTLPQKAAEEIIQLIRTQNFQGGTKLPNEYELSHMLQVSRNTVREAIKLLVSRNILEVRRGAGTFVSSRHGQSIDPLGLSLFQDQKLIFNNLIDICSLVEPRNAALSAQYAVEEDLRLMKQLIEDMETQGSENHFCLEKDLSFHLHIARCSGNIVSYNLYNAFFDTFSNYEYAVFLDTRRMIQEHLQIYNKIKNHDSCGAYDAMLRHVLQYPDRVLFE